MQSVPDAVDESTKGEDPRPEKAVSNASVASTVMRSIKDGKFWEYLMYHPYARLLVSVGISSLNFLIYSEDPVAHSYSEAELPVLGHAYNMLFTHYPDDGRTALKIGLTLLFIFLGIITGRLVVHHMILRDYLTLEMFGWRSLDPDDSQGIVPYCPCNRRTPYNAVWWWQSEARSCEVYGEDVCKESKEDRMKDCHQKGWRTREEYQKMEETAIEVVCPCFCHPKKHKEHTKGTWIVTFFSTIISLFIGAMLYNALIGDSDEYNLDGGLKTRNRVFMKVSACGTWLGDLFTAVMVFDGMLQELARHQEAFANAVTRGEMTKEAIDGVLNEQSRLRPSKVLKMFPDSGSIERKVMKYIRDPSRRLKVGYLRWWPSVAMSWGRKLVSIFTVRVAVVWVIFFTSTTVVLCGILLDFVKWDEWSHGLTASTEVARALLAAVITGLDLFIVMQDWEFPAFDTSQEVKFPGIEISELSCGDCCEFDVVQYDGEGERLSGRKLPCFTAFATGKWFNYGIIFLVMCLDFNMLKNQLVYEPAAYGQYLNTNNSQVCTPRSYDLANLIVADWKATRNPIYENGTYYEERVAGGFLIPGTHDGVDFCMTSKYAGASAAAKYSAALPSFLSVALFFYWLYNYNKLDRKLEKYEIEQVGWFGPVR
eukprot:TRINITY_DN5233_c0_g3_i6.p2 TRINITY_DN5233_c0_g3~~TRINITY_DN5233_c0_g3_i6.p2  ORF type:complete len:652 (+),score=183.40 TRINITY_DN5233_c0_g3_i6:924-2879(+)